MPTLWSLLVLLTLDVSCHATDVIEVTPNCVAWTESKRCAKMTVTLSYLSPPITNPWNSGILIFDFAKNIGDELCYFYISVKDEPVSFLSMCTNDDGVNKFDAVFLVPDLNVYVNYNDTTSQHEYGSSGRVNSAYRSLSDDESGSFCSIIDPSILGDVQEDQLPHVKRQLPSLSKDAVIEIAFSADHLFLQHYGSPEKVEKVIYQIKNGMRAMYQPLGIGIEVVDVYIFNAKMTFDLIRAANYNAERKAKNESTTANRKARSHQYWALITLDYRNNIAGVEGKRVRLTRFPDAVVTFTSRPFDSIKDDTDVLLGFSPTGLLCKNHSAFILMPPWYKHPIYKSGLLADLVHTVTHELGHLLGLDHQKNCSTGCVDQQMGSCIMHPKADFASGHWSECSKTQIRGVLQNPNLIPGKSKQCLFTKDAYNLNASFYVPIESPVVTSKLTTIRTTTAVASSSEHGGTSETPVTSPRGHRTRISAETPGISGKTWIIIAVWVVAVTAITVLFELCKRSGPLVTISSRRLRHKSSERTSKNIRPSQSVSRPSSHDSQKSRRVESPDLTGTHISA